QDLEEKVMATGKIVPREEIEIKPNMSGIIDKILVKEGDKVSAGQLVATLKIVPNVAEVNSAQQQIQTANLNIANAQSNLRNQKTQFAMQQKLYNQGVISKQEYLNAEQQLLTAEQALKNANQQLVTAQKQLQIVRTGA